MKIRQMIISSVTAIAVLGAGSLVLVPAASAANCRYDQFGSNSLNGQRYNCSDGSKMYIKPDFGGDYNRVPQSSFESWGGRDTYGNRYRCNFDSFSNRWKCR